MRRTILPVVVAVLAVSVPVGRGLVAQQPTATFRAASHLVRVDVVVRDRDGNPVRGLTAADFVVTEDNRPQQIRTFSVVDLPFDPPQLLAERRAQEVEPDVVTNSPTSSSPSTAMNERSPSTATFCATRFT